MYLTDNIIKLSNKIGQRVYTVVSEMSIEAWITKEPQPFVYRRSGAYQKLTIGSDWGQLFDCAWMRVYGKRPADKFRHKLVALVDIGGEGLIVDKNGSPICGITNKASSYGVPPDKPGKWVVDLSLVSENDEVEFWIDAACNDLFGYVTNGGIITDVHIATCNQLLKSLYYDVEVLFDWINDGQKFESIHPKGIIPEKIITKRSERTDEIIRILEYIDNTLITFSNEEIIKCQIAIQSIISKNNNPSEFRIMATGHAHLDIAWMWPLREGRRKAIRTFATALTNIEKYPDYIFGASQYQLFHWIKKDYPYFFEKLKKQIAAGRFELQGCFWVECDLNLVSGESLIRQIMHGTRFTLQNFSKKINYVWQPDVFGFPATLPQILKKSGINYIASQKLSQNKINKFNNYLFRWQGLDGSEILMHNFPEDTYDSRARARSLEYIEQNYNEKEICPYALMVYGVGDGGAGPGEEHIERLTRIRNIDGLPHVDFSRVDKFFTHADAFRESLPIISGELYFEAHQGCFTSESATKAHNRIMENKLHDAEFFITITNNMTSILRSEFDEIWKAMLTLQFHDILPGSCISRVYHETEKEYLKLEAKTEKIISDAQSTLLSKIDTSSYKDPHILFNTTCFARNEWININNNWLKARVNSYGYAVIDPKNKIVNGLKAESRSIENNYIKLLFSESGDLISLYDKRYGKEYITENMHSEIRAYHEDAGFFAAWDFASNCRDGESYVLLAEKMTTVISGPKTTMTLIYHYNSSYLRFAFTLTQDSPRVDVQTFIDWHEPNVSLKVKFPVSVQTSLAQCQIQFGVIDRPTHSDDSFAFAKDEIPAHHWVDLSDQETGIALIAKNKYGYRVKDQTLELTLLRSQHKPGEVVKTDNYDNFLINNFADIGKQKFTFSLFPHHGDYRVGGVVNQAYIMNHPLQIVPVKPHPGELPPSLSFFAIDTNSVIIETIKLAEDGDGIIVRLYESYGLEISAMLSWVCNYHYVQYVDLQENKLDDSFYCNQYCNLEFKPFEIITLRLTQ